MAKSQATKAEATEAEATPAVEVDISAIEFSNDGPPARTRKGSGKWVEVAAAAKANPDKWGHVSLATDSLAASAAGRLKQQGLTVTRRSISDTEFQVWFAFETATEESTED